jgi:thymidine kinase
MSGKLTMIVGCMGSGKTEILLRMFNDSENIMNSHLLFKPRIDTRYDVSRVTARSGTYQEAINISDGTDLLRKCVLVDTIYIDEAQFIKGLYAAVREIQGEGVDIVISALPSDFRNRPFGEIGELLSVADDIIHVPATCAVCGGTGTRTKRIVSGDELIVIGGNESYEPRCPSCWEA